MDARLTLPLLSLLFLLLLNWPDGADARRKKHSGTKPAAAAPGLPLVQHAAGASESELYSTGTEQLNRNQLLEALASFDGAVAASSHGGRTNTRVNRGLTLQRLGRLDEALASYNGALGLDPRFLYALYNKGLALRKMGRLAEAIESLRAAVDVNPGYSEAHYDLCASVFEARAPAGDDLAKQTDQHRAYLETAIRSCETSLTLDPKMSMAHETKGLILDVLGRREEAEQATATALSLSPMHRPLATVTKRLRRRVKAPDAEGAVHKLWPSSDTGPEVADSSEPQSEITLFQRNLPYTPLYLVQSTSAATLEMNAGLKDVVHAMMSDDPRGGLVSNIGGWQSQKSINFLEEGATHGGSAGAAVKALHLHITQQVAGFLKDLGLPDGNNSDNGAYRGEALVPFVTIREAWANVNQKGHWNHEHAHGTTVFAGCYYISSGFDDAGGDNTDAATGLRLHSPSSGGGEVQYWSHEGLGKAGTLALWPGSVVHSVPEHTGEDERISIAFNVGLTLQKSTMAGAATQAECATMLSELIPTCGLAYGVQPSQKDYAGMCALAPCVIALSDYVEECPTHGGVSIAKQALATC